VDRFPAIGGLALREGLARFLDASMAEALADFESRSETLTRQLALPEPQMGESAEVQAVGFAPGVLAVGMFRAVEGLAGVLKGPLPSRARLQSPCLRKASSSRTVPLGR
jgi:hypothetical protein